MNDFLKNGSDFSKIDNFNLYKTQDDFKILLKNIINLSLGNKSKLPIKPQYSISTQYGTVKDQKIILNYVRLKQLTTCRDSLN